MSAAGSSASPVTGAGNSSNERIDVGTLLSECIDAAERAGREVRRVWLTGALNVQHKDEAAEDPFTDADLAAQRLIEASLRSRWPNLSLVGEEGELVSSAEAPAIHASILKQETAVSHAQEAFALSQRGDFRKVLAEETPEDLKNVALEDVCVFVDPLDATKEFTQGYVEAVTTLVGISVKERPVAGVMYRPFTGANPGAADVGGTTIWGMRGLGAFGVDALETRAGGLVVATTRSHNTPEVDAALKELQPASVVRVGGAGYKSILLLDGTVDVYLFPTPGTKLWDTCAPEAILECRGFVLTDKLGQLIRYSTDSAAFSNDQGVIAASKQHHDSVIAAVKATL